MTTATLERPVARPAIGGNGQPGSPGKTPGKEIELFGRPSQQPKSMGAHLTNLSSNTGPHRSSSRIKRPVRHVSHAASAYAGGAALVPVKAQLSTIPRAEVELASRASKPASPSADIVDDDVIEGVIVGDGEIIDGVFVEKGSADAARMRAASTRVEAEALEAQVVTNLTDMVATQAAAATAGAEVAVANAGAEVAVQTNHAQVAAVESQISGEVAEMASMAAQRHAEQQVQRLKMLNDGITQAAAQNTRMLSKMNMRSAVQSFMQMHQRLLQMMSDMSEAAAAFIASLAESMRTAAR